MISFLRNLYDIKIHRRGLSNENAIIPMKTYNTTISHSSLIDKKD